MHILPFLLSLLLPCIRILLLLGKGLDSCHVSRALVELSMRAQLLAQEGVVFLFNRARTNASLRNVESLE